jgi:hypothetical protein
MSEVHSALAENFSITAGGPLHRLLVRLGNAGDERQRVVRRALAIAVITWVPLFILSLVQGLAYGRHITIPFLRDYAVNVRLLLTVPILILAESGVDKRWRITVLEFLKSGLVQPRELPAFEAAIEKTLHLRDRILPEALMLVAAFLPLFITRTELLMGNISNWHNTAPGEISMAGWWFNLVCTPLVRLLMLRWLWRMVLWTLLLWRLSRINLYLVATHTDLAAGLGFLSEGQKAFSPIVFACGAIVAAQVGNTIAYQGATLSSQKFPMIAYGVLAIIFLIAPLLVLSPLLIKTKRKALREYGGLVTIHNQLFDQKWIQNEKLPDEVLLGNPDASSLEDLGSSFTVVRQMGVVPIDKPTLITLALAAALPMLPVVFIATPTNELIRIVLKMLG